MTQRMIAKLTNDLSADASEILTLARSTHEIAGVRFVMIPPQVLLGLEERLLATRDHLLSLIDDDFPLECVSTVDDVDEDDLVEEEVEDEFDVETGEVVECASNAEWYNQLTDSFEEVVGRRANTALPPGAVVRRRGHSSTPVEAEAEGATFADMP